VPPEPLLFAAAAALSERVYYYYPWLLALHLLRAPAQDFQLMLNTEFLISYFSLIYHFGG
jgi:hypothetical protein